MIVKENNIRLEPIGTSLEELLDLQNRGYVAQSKKLLKALREAKSAGTMNYTHSWDVEDITEYLKISNTNIESIGATSAEMKGFQREAALTEIKDKLQKAREKPDEKAALKYVNFVMRVAKKEKISLEEIGTDLMELYQLQAI